MGRKNITTVAFLTCSSYRVSREAVFSVHREAISQLAQVCEDMDIELLSSSEVAASEKEMIENLNLLSRRNPIGLVLHYAGWTEDETVLKIVSSFNRPIMLWATNDIFKNGVSQLVSHVGYMEAASFLKKSGYEVFRCYGGPDELSLATLRSFLRAARTLLALHNLKFGWIGPGYGAKGILDSSFDEVLLEKKLGMNFSRIPLEDFFSRYCQTSSLGDDEKENLCSKFGLNSSGIQGIKDADAVTVDDSLRLLRTLSGIVEDYQLDALSLRCFPEFKANGLPTPCLAISAMNNMGIAASCEGDVLSGISMFILSNLCGSPATMMDIFSREPRRNTMDLFHCGSAALSLAEDSSSVLYKTHCKPQVHRAGITTEFPLRKGEVSFLRLDFFQGQFSLYYSGGESILPTAVLRGNQATVRIVTPVKDFIERLIEEGVSHHLVLAMGTVPKEAEFLARMARFRFVSI